jgi:DNA-binding transcriptional regulator YhcF (GntR family)
MYSTINDKHLPGQDVKLLSKKQAAAAFGITYRTIERWYNMKYINYVRIGRRVFVSSSEIYRIKEQFLEDKPNANYLESQIRTIQDIQRRYEQRLHYCYGARR